MAIQNPKRAFALAINSADHLIAKEHFFWAGRLLERYLSLHPPHASVLRRLGRVRLMQGRAAEAVPLLSQALKLESTLSNAA